MTTPTLSGWKATLGPWIVRLAALLATAAIGALAHWLGADPKTVTVEKEVHVPPPPPAEYAPTFGWHADAEAIAANRDAAKTLHFDATPAGRAALGDGDAFLWRQVRKAAGREPPWYPNVNQQS